MSLKKIISPCISICKNDELGCCYGCARTNVEKKIWKNEDTSDEWKIANIKEVKNRMKKVQLETFQESYDHKINYGISLAKKVQKK